MSSPKNACVGGSQVRDLVEKRFGYFFWQDVSMCMSGQKFYSHMRTIMNIM